MNFSTSLDRPSALSCYDCVVSTWSFIVNDSGPCGGTFEIQFCPAHKRDFRAPPVPYPATPNSTTQQTTGTSSDLQSNHQFLEQTPDWFLQDGTPLDLEPHPLQSPSLPLPSFKLWSLCGPVQHCKGCGSIFNKRYISEESPGGPPHTEENLQPQATRSWALYLLDQQAFQRARDDIAAASGGRRINQEKLAKQCSDILKTRDMQVRRRVAVIWFV